MQTTYIQIGSHYLFISSNNETVMEWVREQFKVMRPERWEDCLPDMYIRVEGGYGTAVDNIRVNIHKERDRIYYDRDDFRIETDDHYRRVMLSVHDDVSLNHAIMTVYSAFIVHIGWGLMIHSSCVAEGGKAYIFAGVSGAGKSTVAKLSMPRKILSDEATLVRIDEDGASVFDSPFRSDSEPTFDSEPLPLAGIHLLEQSQCVERSQVKPMETIVRLMDKIFYWAVDPQETVKLLAMCRRLADRIPAYELLFQKNDSFWERIS